MKVEVFHVLQPILPAVGWVCSDRRKSIDDQFENLNNAVQRLEKSAEAYRES